MKLILIKTTTIVLFISLLSIYIAFRSGYFGGEKSTVPVSPNGGALNNQTKTIDKDSNYVSKMDSATFFAISSKSMNIFPETNDLINSMNKPYIVNELIRSLGSFDYKPVSIDKDSIIHISKANTVSEDFDLLEKSRIKEEKQINNFILREKESRKRVPSSKLSSSKTMILAPEIIEVLKKDSSDKDTLKKK